jgi:hypothetical protein
MEIPGVVRGRQQGMTFIGYVIILAIIGFFVLIILKLTPPYLEYFRVKRQLQSLEEEAGLRTKSSAQVRKLLQRRFGVDDIEGIPPDQIKIAKKEAEVKIDITWQRQVHMMGNVEALLSFDIKKEFRAE